jgi:hypothetical protein
MTVILKILPFTLENGVGGKKRNLSEMETGRRKEVGGKR